MFLQRQLATRLYDYTLNSVTCGQVDVLIVAPGPVHAAVLDCRARVLRFELFDQLLNVLGSRARHDEDRIRRCHYNDVIEADYGCEDRVFRWHKPVPSSG